MTFPTTRGRKTMARGFGVMLAGAAVLLAAGVAAAQMGGGMSGGMGGGMMGIETGRSQGPEITAEQAQKAATEYARQYLPGFTVKRTAPLTGTHLTMYEAELTGQGGATRVVHVNAWGTVMPFGGSRTR